MMAYTNTDILSFLSLFDGNRDAYGVTEVGDIVNGKAQSKSRLVYDTVTPAVIQRHLEGSVSIGVAPIRSDGTCNFGAIDIDDYKYTPGRTRTYIAALSRRCLPGISRVFHH